jgi:hypothetical protein
MSTVFINNFSPEFVDFYVLDKVSERQYHQNKNVQAAARRCIFEAAPRLTS